MLLSMFFYPLLLAVVAVIYKCFLAHEEVLGWWFAWGAKFNNKWFHKPIWGCVYCIAGQLALWSYLASWFLSSNLMEISPVGDFLRALVYLPSFGCYSLLLAFIFICCTIAYTKALVYLYAKYVD